MLHSCIVPLTRSLSHTSIVTSSKHRLKPALPCELQQYTRIIILTITAGTTSVILHHITSYCDTRRDDATRYDTIRYDIVHYTTTPHHTTRHHMVLYHTTRSIRYYITRHDTTQHTAPQRIGNHYNILLPVNPLLVRLFFPILVLVVSARCIYPRTHSDLAR